MVQGASSRTRQVFDGNIKGLRGRFFRKMSLAAAGHILREGRSFPLLFSGVLDPRERNGASHWHEGESPFAQKGSVPTSPHADEWRERRFFDRCLSGTWFGRAVASPLYV